MSQLWPEEWLSLPDGVRLPGAEPDRELAVILLAAGCTWAFVRERCGFPTVRAAQAFARDEEVRRAVRELQRERVERLGSRALVKLERMMAAEHTDLRAEVLAVRTALEVSGELRRKEATPPLRQVSELSVAELSELIEATKRELFTRRRPDAPATLARLPGKSTT